MKKILFLLMSIIVLQYMMKRKEIKTLNNELVISKKTLDSLNSQILKTEDQLNIYNNALEKMRENDSTCVLLFEALMDPDF